MKKIKSFSKFVIILFFVMVFCSSFSLAFTGAGAGTSTSPYQVNSWSTLNQIRNNLTAYYILTTNLTTTSTGYTGIGDSWIPIGNYTNQFKGNFNGQNNTISGLRAILPTAEYVGLFGYSSAYISNIGLINARVKGLQYVGILVGQQDGKSITNSYSFGNANGSGRVGGLVGTMNGGFGIINCYSGANVQASQDGGGLVGNSHAYIINSYATGEVNGSYTGGLVGTSAEQISNSYATGNINGVISFPGTVYHGGLVGLNYAPILDSYATGNVSGRSTVGGLVGYHMDGEIIRSYSIGKITGSVNIGGLVGDFTSGSIQDSFWDINTSGRTTSAGSGAIGKTTAQMKNISNFSSWSITNMSRFILNAGYPYLTWQNKSSSKSYTWEIYVAPPAIPVCTSSNCSEDAWLDGGGCISPGIESCLPDEFFPANCDIEHASADLTELYTRTCDMPPNTPPCTTINYYPWSTCNLSGKQTRTVLLPTIPENCIGGVDLILTQDCDPITTCLGLTTNSQCEGDDLENEETLAQNYLLGINETIANTCGTAIDCYCEWNSEDEKCIGVFNYTDTSVIPSTTAKCTWSEATSVDTCSQENGKVTVTYTATITPTGASLPECTTQVLEYPCSVSAKLPFFDNLTFLISALSISLIYFLFRKTN